MRQLFIWFCFFLLWNSLPQVRSASAHPTNANTRETLETAEHLDIPLPPPPPPTRPIQQKTDALLLRSFAWMHSKQDAKQRARRLFEQALRQDPGLVLPSDMPASVRKQYERWREAFLHKKRHLTTRERQKYKKMIMDARGVLAMGILGTVLSLTTLGAGFITAAQFAALKDTREVLLRRRPSRQRLRRLDILDQRLEETRTTTLGLFLAGGTLLITGWTFFIYMDHMMSKAKAWKRRRKRSKANRTTILRDHH